MLCFKDCSGLLLPAVCFDVFTTAGFVHPWVIGGYWTLPLQYIQNAIAINELTGGVPYPAQLSALPYSVLCPALPCHAWTCPILQCLALPCPVMPCLALLEHALFCRALPCLALPCPALSCPALPYSLHCPALCPACVVHKTTGCSKQLH